MNRPVKSLLLLLLILNTVTLSSPLAAQTKYSKTIYNAFISGDFSIWLSIINTIEHSNEALTNDQELELVSYYYGYVSHLIRNNEYDKALAILPKGDKHIANILKDSPLNPTAHSYKASFLGFRISISKFKAFTLGAESTENIDVALKTDPNNIQALVDKGNSLFHLPGIFGGDKVEAMRLYLKAMKLMEQTGKTEENWFYLNLLTIIGKSYMKLDKLPEAKLSFEKALRKEPDYMIVKTVLYPNLLKTMH